jgi:hypothetical protein
MGRQSHGTDSRLREKLGDHDRDEWAIYCKGRDPWILQFYLPFYHPISGEQFIWSTNSGGGEDAIGNVLKAYIDRVDFAPEDETILPRIELSSGGYNHRDGFFVATPELNIVGWVKPPAIPRPTLPPPPPLPSALPSPASSNATAIEKTKKTLDDEIPF